MDQKTEIHTEMQAIAESARRAYQSLANAETDRKNKALTAAAQAIRDRRNDILDANAHDIEAAGKARLSAALIDRLTLSDARIDDIAGGLEQIGDLDDPVGRELRHFSRPNGLEISQVSVPLGVIAIIYESRPNVTADAGGLCLKAGNAAILRGGSEAYQSNRAIHRCLVQGLEATALPTEAIQLVQTTDRAAVGALLAMNGLIDVIVPRGGKSLIARVQEESRIPVLAHLEGLCHVYVDGDADPDMAREITINAKMRRPGICGAAETLLVDQAAIEQLPDLVAALIGAGCELRGDEAARDKVPDMKSATTEDWRTEYLAPILAIRIVDGVDGAIEHIARFGSGHTDSIVTSNTETAERFLKAVDSAIVLHNASTQFADGGEFGFGAEIGIATGRLHARGPVGVEQLTTYKYVVRGSGQTRP